VFIILLTYLLTYLISDDVPFSDVEDAWRFHDHHSELVLRAADADVV